MAFFDIFKKYDNRGFDKNGVHRNGTEYDENGYDIRGFNIKGVHRNGSYHDKYGYDIHGYNERGFNRFELHKNGTKYNEEGYNYCGYYREGYNKDGFNKDGYNRAGYDKWGYDKDGYDRNGYNHRGFDRNGFDMQGYNLKGEYFEFIDKYLSDNTNIKIKNKELLYSEKVKNIFIDIELCKRNISIEDYVGALSHLRRAAGRMLTEVLLQSGMEYNKFKGLTSFKKINIIKENRIIADKEIELLDEIRLTGNESVHQAIGNENETLMYLEKFKNFLHNWLEINNK